MCKSLLKRSHSWKVCEVESETESEVGKMTCKKSLKTILKSQISSNTVYRLLMLVESLSHFLFGFL